MVMQTFNPATGEIIATYQALSRTEVTGIIGRAQNAFNSWKEVRLSVRTEKMIEAARILRSGARDYAVLMAQEMGKPFKQGIEEVEK